MVQKRYLSLGDEQHVLALLQRGYSFIEPGGPILDHDLSGNPDASSFFTEAIPRTEVNTEAEFMLLSQFLKSAPSMVYQVDSSYLQ